MDVTYSQVAQEFLTQLIGICDNINRYDAINNENEHPFTTFSRTIYPAHDYVVPTGGQTPTYIPSYTYYISGNKISKRTASELTDDFDAFVDSLGLTLSDHCTVNGMFYLLENLTEFALKNIRFATSHATSSKWVVYVPSSETVKIHDMSELNDNYNRFDVVQELITNYINNIKGKLRAYPAIYTYVCNN